jgi:DNA-binding SARP family transcriptional activator
VRRLPAMYAAAMRFALLGPLEVTTDDGRPVDVGGRQPRLVLAVLAAAAGRPVSAGSLIEAVWGESPPASAAGTLQSYVSRLRRTLDAGEGSGLVHDDGSYRLELTGHSVDIDRFGELVGEGHELLIDGQPTAARTALVEALALWRGPALVELVDRGVAIGRAAALDE